MEQVKSDERPVNPGAMDELARDPASRKRFLKMVGGAGAAGAFAIFAAACGSDDDKSNSAGSTTGTAKSGGGSKSDIEIVNYALTLEFLEADFYAKVIDAGILSGALLDAAKQIRENEDEHVTALTSTVERLGGTPAEKPKTKFPLDGGRDAVLELAATVENLGAAAYLGQAGRIKDKEVLAAALSIHTVEARHAAALNTVVGKTIVPDGAFAKPASMEDVLAEVQPFIAS